MWVCVVFVYFTSTYVGVFFLFFFPVYFQSHEIPCSWFFLFFFFTSLSRSVFFVVVYARYSGVLSNTLVRFETAL